LFAKTWEASGVNARRLDLRTVQAWKILHDLFNRASAIKQRGEPIDWDICSRQERL
jgi:hypothetical protein